MFSLRVLFIAILLGSVHLLRAAPCPFVDEGVSDPDFSAFRERLVRVAKRRDFQSLRSMVHPGIIVGFAGGKGRNEFLSKLRDEPGLWERMIILLRQGGRFIHEEGRRVFYAPYTFFATIPGRDADAIVVLTGKSRPVYADPNHKAPVLLRLHDEALEVHFGGRADNHRWFEVRLPWGGLGFVSAEDAVLADGERIGFVQEGGHWCIHFFGGGD